MNTIDEFLSNYSSKSTKRTYKCYIKNYFKLIDVDPDHYFNTNRDYEADVLTLWRSIADKPPKSIYTALTAIRVFLMENNVELSQKFWKKLRLRTKGNRAVTDDKVPSPNELKRILEHTDVKSRAFFLTLLSSGMRIGEICSIKLVDVDLTKTPTTINIRREYTKTGDRRTAFISKEATENLKAWLKHRDVYLKAAISRAKIFQNYHNRPDSKKADDDRVFPFNTGTARDMWNRMLKNADLNKTDPTTKIHQMHPHVLRKYFRTHMALEIPLDVVEALMGHEAYLTEAYRRYSLEQLMELYLKAEHRISVFERPPDLTEHNERIRKLEEDNKKVMDENKAIRQLLADLYRSNPKH